MFEPDEKTNHERWDEVLEEALGREPEEEEQKAWSDILDRVAPDEAKK